MNNVMREDGGILILAETEGQEIAPITFELLGMGRKIAEERKKPLSGVALGHEMPGFTQDLSRFVDRIYMVNHPLLTRFDGGLYADALEQLCRDLNPDIVLIGHTLAGLELAPRLSFKMGVPVMTDCIQLSIAPETGNLMCHKPVYGGKAVGTFELKKKPFIATLRPKAVEAYSQPGSVRGEMVHFDPVLDESTAKIQRIKTVREENVSLNKAEAIVAGGRGIRDAEGLKLLQELVSVLRTHLSKVELGGSRPLVDARLIPSSRQIGLTGEKVAPAIYFAVGISGSLQHMTGILGAKKIVSINSNPKAPIFRAADYGVIGNFEDVVPALIRKLRELECRN